MSFSLTVSVIDIISRMDNLYPMRRMSPESDRLYRAVGQKIRDTRSQTGLTQETLATRIRAARTTITNIEKGSQAATLHQLWSIAQVLEVDVADLLPGRSEVESGAIDTRIQGIDAPRTRSLLRTLTSDATGDTQ
jgi:transcriptional regulator with XRE-family HTH domain